MSSDSRDSQIAKGEEAKTQVQLASSLKDSAEAKLKTQEAEFEQLKKSITKATSDLKNRVGIAWRMLGLLAGRILQLGPFMPNSPSPMHA